MANTVTVSLPDDLARWLEESARRTGVSKSRLVRDHLERARASAYRPFMRLAGAVSAPRGLSARKGFSTK